MAQISLNDQLLLEVRTGNVGRIKKVLRQGASVDYINSDGDFVLKLAAVDDKVFNVVKLLLKEGATVDLVNKDGVSALMTACKNGCIEIVRLLLSKHASVHLKDLRGYAAFTHLCTNTTSRRSTFFELAEQLLTHGADIHQQDDTGKISPDVCM